MSLPDAVTGGLIVFGAQEIYKEAKAFVTALCGHPGESVGEIVGNLSHRRLTNAEKIVEKAALITLDIGTPPADIPLRIGQPILEGGSLEENAAMQERWANMLANAADPTRRNPVEPCFPVMLKELSSREVIFLDRIIDKANGLTINMKAVSLQMEFAGAGLSRLPANIPVPNALAGQPNAIQGEDLTNFTMMMDIVIRQNILIKNEYTVTGDYRFTQLGRAFVLACRRPPK